VCVCVCVCVVFFLVNYVVSEDRLLLYAHRHRSTLEAAGHIILTPANQLMVMELKIRSLSNPGFEPRTFRSLAQPALTGPCCFVDTKNYVGSGR
jgi:hypothetical protein